MTGASPIPVQIDDPVNVSILAVSEDKLEGFQRDPFCEISGRSGVDLDVVIGRIRAALEAGIIRRVRQTLLSTNLAQGALVAWQVPPARLHAAFDFMFQEDPFSGHVVIRTADANAPGANYKLWTTLKVPQGYSIERHADYLKTQTGAERYRLMPAKAIFALGVGHPRRRGMEPGSKSDGLAEVNNIEVIELSELEWRVLIALKREFTPDEIVPDLWRARAEEAGVPLATFYEIAESLSQRKVIGRAVPLGGATRPGGRSWPRGGPPPHPDPLLLAGSRRRVPERELDGGGARHREGATPRAQSGDRRPPGVRRDPGELHERVLGGPQ